ncbi:outer membrane beta-barrel protein [Pontibacter pamirensis]|uniref:outer membrane beta-barrel protein n=1 Tax=Pontibacter pamirensis TaxID=2562824 RepID=UPI0013894779|nr:outer membrane beta-barrel protein [Pontibacter pamirensis]
MLNKRKAVSKVPDERGVVLAVGGGLAAVRSDICGGPDCNRFGPNVSLGALYYLTNYLGVSGSIDYLRLGATEGARQRPLNISFRSEVVEVTGTVVINLLDSYAGSGGYRSLRKRFLVPYLRAGAGIVYYTPTSYPGQGKLNESQTTYEPAQKYPAIAAVIPFGGGLRFRINKEFSIAPELIYHITTTDYLDNIGPELGNAQRDDHYGIAAVKVLYTPALRNRLFSRK